MNHICLLNPNKKQFKARISTLLCKLALIVIYHRINWFNVKFVMKNLNLDYHKNTTNSVKKIKNCIIKISDK